MLLGFGVGNAAVSNHWLHPVVRPCPSNTIKEPTWTPGIPGAQRKGFTCVHTKLSRLPTSALQSQLRNFCTESSILELEEIVPRHAV